MPVAYRVICMVEEFPTIFLNFVLYRHPTNRDWFTLDHTRKEDFFKFPLENLEPIG